MLLVGIYPNGAPAITGPSQGTKKTDRIIETSSHFILSIKLHVDLDVLSTSYHSSQFWQPHREQFYSSCSAVISRKRSAFEMKFYLSLKTWVRDHGDSFSRAM